jgi:RHS repeat-associated protein
MNRSCHASGERVAYTLDSLDRLTGEKHVGAAGQAISEETYTYDLVGNRSKKTALDTTGNPLITVNYALSTGNRLGSWSVAETNLAGQVDVAGVSSEPIGTNDRFGWLYVSNAATSVKPLVSGTNFCVYDFTVGLGTQKIVAAIRDAAGNMGYATNTIVLSVVTNGAYQYSAAGCVTNIQYKGKDYQQSFGLTWDSQYRLTAVSTNGGVVERYGYDAVGRRAWMWDATAGTNWMVYDGSQVVADLDATGRVLRTYVWGPGIDNLLAMTVYGTTTNTYYALKDHLNSVLALTDSSGQIVEQYRYDAWGRTTVFDASGSSLSFSAVGNRYCWQGREYSWRTGLYYFRARWYDPITGRWLSNDPIGISDGLNQYVFCANNPINNVDPFGLCKGESTSWLDDIATRWGLTWRAVRYGEWRALGADFEKQFREINRRAEEDPYGFALSFATGGTTALGKGLGGSLSKGGFKLLSDREIGKLIRNDLPPHSLKPKPHSRYDLYKDPKGNVHVFPKGGQGSGDPTGININDL